MITLAYKAVIDMLEAGDFDGAFEAVKALQTGVDWEYGGDDDDEAVAAFWPEGQRRDGELYSVLNDIASARMLSGTHRQHFRRLAVLRIRALSGDVRAAQDLERAIVSGALSAEAELRRFDGGQN